MQKQTTEKLTHTNSKYSPLDLKIDFENYLKQKKKCTNKKVLTSYDGITIALTKKQTDALVLVAKGYSNSKIAKELSSKETAVKLLIYRLMKYLESSLYERIDRLYLIIVAQKLNLENDCQSRRINNERKEV